MKRITKDDIKGSVPGDAYSFMDPEKMKIDDSHGVSCSYCENVAKGLRPAYMHYKEKHKEFWDKKMKGFTSEKKVGSKIIRKMPALENTPEDERHVINQCATNKNICIIDFDVLVERVTIEEDIPEDLDAIIDLGDINKEDLDKLIGTLKGWLTYAKRKAKDKKKEKIEHVHSQNVGRVKLPNVIDRLLSEDAISVIIKKNKLGNYEVKFTKKEKPETKEEEKSDEDDDGLFNIDNY